MAYTKTVWVDNSQPAINATNLNHIENGIESVENELAEAETNIMENIGGTILWTNSSPTSSMASQNIALSSSDYDVLEVFYKSASNQSNCSSLKIIKGYGGIMIATSVNFTSNNIYIRGITRNSDTSYTIGTGYTLGTSKTENNAVCIPIYAVGYKTGIFS